MLILIYLQKNLILKKSLGNKIILEITINIKLILIIKFPAMKLKGNKANRKFK